MRIYEEKSLRDFEFWSGAKFLAARLTDDEFDTIESMLEDCAPEEGWSETAINDLFWFEGETIAEWLDTTEDELNEREER